MRSNSVQSSADSSIQAIMVVLLISHGYLLKPKYKTKCKRHNKGIKVSMLIKTLIPGAVSGVYVKTMVPFLTNKNRT